MSIMCPAIRMQEVQYIGLFIWPMKYAILEYTFTPCQFIIDFALSI